MKIIYSSAYDTTLPLMLKDDTAVLSTRYVGPQGLLEELELRTGCSGVSVDTSGRVLEYYKALVQAAPGAFYGVALADGPLAVAEHLLSVRDELVEAGFSFEPDAEIPERLEVLCRVEKRVPAAASVRYGFGDRVNRVVQALQEYETVPVSLDAVEVRERREWLAWPVRRLLDALERVGIQVEYTELSPAGDAQSDIGRLQRALLSKEAGAPSFKNDGSVVVAAVPTLTEALQRVSRVLRDDNVGKQTAFIVPEGRRLLDEFLAIDGNPAVGSRDEGPSSIYSHLHLLSVFLWEPMDVDLLARLLASPLSPFPRRMSLALRDALLDVPGLCNPLWQEKYTESLAAIEDEEYRSRVRERYERLFISSRSSRSEGAEVDTVRELFLDFSRLLRGRGRGTDGNPAILAAACEWLSSAVDLFFGGERVQPHRLRQLVEHYISHQTAPVFREEAGRTTVLSSPYELNDEVDQLIWLPAVETSGAGKNFFTHGERDWLRLLGVYLEEPRLVAERNFAVSVETLSRVRSRVLLVVPDEQGREARNPDPVVPVIEAMLGSSPQDRALFSQVVLSEHEQPVESHERIRLPQRQGEWQLPKTSIIPDRQESFSSLSDLFYYPYRYVLNYVAGLKRRPLTVKPPGPLLFGSFLHKLVEYFFEGGGLPESEAVIHRWLADNIESLLHSYAAPLLLPGEERRKAHLQSTAERVLVQLSRQLQEAGVQRVKCEVSKQAQLGDVRLGGRIDVLGEGAEEPLVIDIKWGGYEKRYEEIAQGTALQLAVYALLLGGEQGAVSLAYLIAGKNRTISFAGSLMPNAEVPFAAGEAAEAVPALITAMNEVLLYRYDQLQSGRVRLSPEDTDEVLPGGLLVLPKEGHPYDDYLNLLGWSVQ